MLRNLHLSALRAFEAATRTGSFRLVADDLGLTFWTFPANLLAGAAAAAGIALIQFRRQNRRIRQYFRGRVAYRPHAQHLGKSLSVCWTARRIRVATAHDSRT